MHLRVFLSYTLPVGLQGLFITIILVLSVMYSPTSYGSKPFSGSVDTHTGSAPAKWIQASYDTHAGSKRMASSLSPSTDIIIENIACFAPGVTMTFDAFVSKPFSTLSFSAMASLNSGIPAAGV
ncbi:MAG: hypothetical protein A4E23_01117 [Methanomethylovorans sp. PtaU1.Bin073]|nr:MAG: hypothetical protein A4E23_01117 [Methanomethylovorans sp. PtaU1.Bin073]